MAKRILAGTPAPIPAPKDITEVLSDMEDGARGIGYRITYVRLLAELIQLHHGDGDDTAEALAEGIMEISARIAEIAEGMEVSVR